MTTHRVAYNQCILSHKSEAQGPAGPGSLWGSRGDSFLASPGFSWLQESFDLRQHGSDLCLCLRLSILSLVRTPVIGFTAHPGQSHLEILNEFCKDPFSK